MSKMIKILNNVFVCNCQFLCMTKTPNSIWIKVEGKIVQDGSIEISNYAKILLNYQKLIHVLQEVNFPKARKGAFKLFLTNVYPGSSISKIQPQFQTSVLSSEPIYDKITNDFKELFESLLQDDDEFIKELESRIKDPGEILKFLKPAREILSKKDYRVYTGFSIEMPKSYIIFPQDREELIDSLIKKYTEDAAIEIKGIIIRRKSDDPRHFIIKTVEGDTITVNHTQELENYIHQLYLKPVIAKGIMRTGIRKKEFEELVKLSPFNIVSLDSLGDFKFKMPIVFDVKYHDDDGIWCISNEELSIIGCNETYDGALERLQNNLNGLISGLTLYDPITVSVKTREIEKNLKKYLDIEEYSSMLIS